MKPIKCKQSQHESTIVEELQQVSVIMQKDHIRVPREVKRWNYMIESHTRDFSVSVHTWPNNNTAMTAPEKINTVSSVCVAAPGCCVLEHAQPRWRCQRWSQVPWGPGPLPAQGAALWMRHHGQVSPVSGTEPRYAPWGAVRVQRVLFGGVTLVIKVT